MTSKAVDPLTNRPKRPTSPAEGDTPCKKSAPSPLPFLPHTSTPLFESWMLAGGGGGGGGGGGRLSPATLPLPSRPSAASSSEGKAPVADDSPYDSDEETAEEGSLLSANDTLSPFLQSILSGQRRARDEEVFCSVPGRMSLLSQANKYQVTVGEIRRRLGSPESLNASLLGGILRRAKSKNGGKMLRDAIQAVGMQLPVGRRKSIKISLLTSLVEGESLQLARDFSSICTNEFPIREMAALAEGRRRREGEEEKRRIHRIQSARQLIKEFVETIGVEGGGEGSEEQEVARGLSHFSLATHSFGLEAIRGVASTFIRYLDQQEEYLTRPATMGEHAAQYVASRFNGSPPGKEGKAVEAKEAKEHKDLDARPCSAFKAVKQEPLPLPPLEVSPPVADSLPSPALPLLSNPHLLSLVFMDLQRRLSQGTPS